MPPRLRTGLSCAWSGTLPGTFPGLRSVLDRVGVTLVAGGFTAAATALLLGGRGVGEAELLTPAGVAVAWTAVGLLVGDVVAPVSALAPALAPALDPTGLPRSLPRGLWLACL